MEKKMVSASEAKKLLKDTNKVRVLENYLPKIEEQIKRVISMGNSDTVLHYLWDSDDGKLIVEELEKFGYKCESYRTSFDYFEQYTDDYIKVSW